MATPAVPVVAPAIHPSWFSKAVTWVKHEASVVKNSIMWLAGKEPAVAAEIGKIAPTVEMLSNMIVPGLGNIEQHIVDVYGVVAAAVDQAGAAAAANGVSLSLDQKLILDVQAVLPAIKKYLSPAAGPAPATPPATPAP
jgi:hypothetical protein